MADEPLILPTKSAWEAVRDTVKRVGGVTGAGSSGPGGIAIGPPRRRRARPAPDDNHFPARITGGDSSAGFTWIEQLVTDEGDYEDLQGGRDTVARAWEVNGGSVGVDTIVMMREFAGPFYAFEVADPTAILRIVSAYTGKGWYAAQLTAPPTSDADVTTDLSTTAATFLANAGASVIACNLFEALAGNHAGLLKPLAANELFLGRYWSTQSNGTNVYVITGGFRMIDASNYMVPLFNAGQWGPDWPRAH